jgi:hypothetical protein
MGGTIFGRSFSSLACSYSVSMFSAARKQSVGCETSKSDDMARTEKRCEGHAGPAIRSHQYNPSDQKRSWGRTHLFFIAVLLNTRSSSFHVRHYDRMKPMTSPAATHHRSTWDDRIQHKKIKERRSGHAPIMYVPHIVISVMMRKSLKYSTVAPRLLPGLGLVPIGGRNGPSASLGVPPAQSGCSGGDDG